MHPLQQRGTGEALSLPGASEPFSLAVAIIERPRRAPRLALSFLRASFGSSHGHPAAPSLSTCILLRFVQITPGSLSDDSGGALLLGGV